MKSKNRIKKYTVNLRTVILLVVIMFLCLGGYTYCAYVINSVSLQTVSDVESTGLNISVLSTIRDITLAVVSVLGTNLLLSILVEVKSKNALITDIIQNDVISSPEFYETMDPEYKKKMFAALETNLFFDYPIVHDMFDNIRDKLNSTVDHYFFESCDYVISCKIFEKYIEKEITKKVIIKSYEDSYSIKDFSVGNIFSREIDDGIEPFVLLSVEINGTSIDVKKDFDYRPIKMRNLDEQNKYNYSVGTFYKKEIQISNEQETKIIVKCKTRSPSDDTVSTFRVTKPCKRFSLKYDLKNDQEHRLSVDAFGFLDNADESLNTSSDSSLNITFNEWIFKDDGVVVSILNK